MTNAKQQKKTNGVMFFVYGGERERELWPYISIVDEEMEVYIFSQLPTNFTTPNNRLEKRVCRQIKSS